MLISAYVNGSTGGYPPPARDHSHDALRGEVRGWSRDAVRRQNKWLYSVDTARLDCAGYAVTLTVRDCPGTAQDWAGMRRNFVKRMERAGMVRIHWLTEWTLRKVPHLHAAVYFPEHMPRTVVQGLVLVAWLEVAEVYGADFPGQDVKSIDGTLGWLKYLSKHASRGVGHYQRSGAPVGWERTGRLWGHGGSWPVDLPQRFSIPNGPASHRYRRLVRAWRLADARASGDPRRIRAARRMYHSADPKVSAVRGMSEWCPEHVVLAFMGLLLTEGVEVRQMEDDHG